MADEILAEVALRAIKGAVNFDRRVQSIITMVGETAVAGAYTVPADPTDAVAIPLGDVPLAWLGLCMIALPSTAAHAVDIGTGLAPQVAFLTVQPGEAILVRFHLDAVPTWKTVTTEVTCELILLEH